jgi:hypothetical protein
VDRPTRTLFAVLLIGIVVVTALAAILIQEPSGPDLVPGTEQMTGVVVAVDSSGLADVRGFVLRRPGGELVEFSLRALENGTQFPPGHLAEHQATAEPVRVVFRTEGAERLALRLEDAPR